jgi:wobble nucleotide-excising tRNase
MLKRIKHIKKVGIYRDFSWQGNTCFRRYNAMYGFNGSGKSTLARIFGCLDGSKLELRETGSSIVFEDYGNSSFELKDDEKHRDVLVYDEDFISNNLKWEQGIKSFVVIGKKSKEEEDKLSSLAAKKLELITEKKITEANQKQLNDSISELATAYASDLRKELIQHNSQKYNRYDKRPFQSDVSNNKADPEFKYTRSDVSELKSKLTTAALEKISRFENPLSSIFLKIEDAKNFIKLPLPTKPNTEYSAVELGWLELGIEIHAEKNNCLFCKGVLSEARKTELNQDLTNEVAHFIKKGKSLYESIYSFKMQPNVFQSKQFYSEFKELFESTYTQIQDKISEFDSLLKKITEILNKKIEFQEITIAEDLENGFDSIKTSFEQLTTDINDLIDKNNATTSDFESRKKKCVEAIERIYIEEYKNKALGLTGRLEEETSKHKKQEEAIHKITTEIAEIEMSLQSEAKAIIGINNMLNVFLGRSDLKLEFREESKKFEIVRKGVPAKRLSEGEKTAIAVCYFLILVNANSESKKNLIVLIDDPISSLDTNNLYNAYAVLKNNLIDVKQLFVLTHNLYFFRLIWKWFRDFGNENSYFRIETTNLHGEISASINGMEKLTRETSTEYILLYIHLKTFIKRCEKEALSDSDFLPYPNILRRLLEAYLFTKFPGREIGDFNKELGALGVKGEIALLADRFCNDFSHARFDSLYGQEGNPISVAPTVVKDLVCELERIDPDHFNSMKNFVA